MGEFSPTQPPRPLGTPPTTPGPSLGRRGRKEGDGGMMRSEFDKLGGASTGSA
ncbi:hypothetical protein [Lacihabitans soyangensis]|uniref:hypothetical protein n=1 Tax=Lacihabitans soyangensis TaxID=869394 RepID=UPI0020CEDDA8|nr:hypothetical protein [Lacihabitans soyangensis]